MEPNTFFFFYQHRKKQHASMYEPAMAVYTRMSGIAHSKTEWKDTRS